MDGCRGSRGAWHFTASRGTKSHALIHFDDGTVHRRVVLRHPATVREKPVGPRAVPFLVGDALYASGHGFEIDAALGVHELRCKLTADGGLARLRIVEVHLQGDEFFEGGAPVGT